MFSFGIGWELSEQDLKTKKREQLFESKEEKEMFQELRFILRTKNIKAVFQPIVSLTDADIVGYEALSRGPQGSIMERPDVLFPAAERFDKVWELEFLCRAKALEKAQQMAPNKMLFINVAPNIIKDSRFHKGVTRELLEKCGINSSNIIFEITEKTSVEDYKSFRRVLANYTSQGYKIAIDDTGSGYSGLKMLAETRPQFIKIDMDLVRNIDKDALKRALMKAFYDFSVITNMKIIAEGIETVDELNTLISIGIPYGQGYLLQKPAAEFLEIHPQIRELILTQNRQKRRETFHTPLNIPIGDIARQDGAFTPDATGCQIIDYFNSHSNVLGVTVVQDARPVGLMMKDKFFSQLATQYGVAVYMNRPVHLLMDKHPLIVDYQTSLEQVSKFAVSRSEDRLYDYIIITKNDQYYGITTVKQLLEKTTQLEVNRAKHANPLSGLPGNVIIEEKLKQVIENEEEFSVLYFDLDNFKAYNDVYGFENGDKVLRMTAQTVQEQLNQAFFDEAFLGHIGGDDFVAVIKQTKVDALCERIIASFDARVKDFYTEEHQRQGFITAKNRHGTEERFPLTSLSIAVVNSKGNVFKSITEIAETAGRIKKKCKLTWESCYCVADAEVV